MSEIILGPEIQITSDTRDQMYPVIDGNYINGTGTGTGIHITDSPNVKISNNYIANKDDLPTRLERAIVEGAAAARFKGSPGQFFEGFVEREDKVVRVALAGAGNPDAEPHRREEALEKAGAVLAAKYLTSGERDLVLDFASSDLDAAGAASVLLGLRLRSWRHDAYRTKLKDEQKKSLSQVTVVNAPAGTPSVE